MNIHERQKQVDKLTIDVESKRREAETERQRAQQLEDTPGKAEFHYATAEKAEQEADTMETQITQETQALEADKAKLGQLEQQRSQEDSRHEAEVARLQKEIDNLSGGLF